MATLVQCSPNTQGHGESSLVIADSENTGALQQVMTAALKNSRGRNRVPVYLKLVVDCECDACWLRVRRWDPVAAYNYAPQDEAHSSIELCEISDCDSRYGIRRMPDTEHLFKAQFGHARNIRCRCAAPACTFACERRCDLRRHHVTKHCISPKRYPCPEPFCVYGGENGFKRLDKLKDHHRKVHEGKLRPVHTQRPIQSAATKPTAE